MTDPLPPRVQAAMDRRERRNLIDRSSVGRDAVHDDNPPALVVFVPGDPAPQGSKRYLGNGRMGEASKKVAPWRADVRGSLIAVWGANPPIGFAVRVDLEFVMPRPASTPKRYTPPAVKKADVDKLARAVLDAVTSAGVWADDKQVCDLRASKRLAEIGEQPGCWISVRPLEAEEAA